MTRLGGLLILLPSLALADGPYVDASAGWARGLVQELDQRGTVAPSPWLHAQFEVGYELGRFSIFAQHTSSPMTRRDHGMNMLGVRFRLAPWTD